MSGRSKKLIAFFLGGILLLAGIAVGEGVGLKDFSEKAISLSHSINPILLIILFALLPAFGFPITLVYLAAGLRFGAAGGLAVVAACTFFHIAIPFLISRKLFRKSFARWMARSRHKLPETSSRNGWFISLLAALFPGLPYFMRNYLLGMTDTHFKVILAVCWPVFVLRSFLVIYAGDLSKDWDLRKVLLFVLIYGVKLAFCGWLVLRLKSNLKAAPAA